VHIRKLDNNRVGENTNPKTNTPPPPPPHNFFPNQGNTNQHTSTPIKFKNTSIFFLIVRGGGVFVVCFYFCFLKIFGGGGGGGGGIRFWICIFPHPIVI